MFDLCDRMYSRSCLENHKRMFSCVEDGSTLGNDDAQEVRRFEEVSRLPTQNSTAFCEDTPELEAARCNTSFPRGAMRSSRAACHGSLEAV